MAAAAQVTLAARMQLFDGHENCWVQFLLHLSLSLSVSLACLLAPSARLFYTTKVKRATGTRSQRSHTERQEWRKERRYTNHNYRCSCFTGRQSFYLKSIGALHSLQIESHYITLQRILHCKISIASLEFRV